MKGLLELQKRMQADCGRIFWQPKDYERLAKHYRVKEADVARLAPQRPVTTPFPEAVTKSAAPDVQRSFRWIMNDGLPDRSNDVVDPRGVSLEHFKANNIALLQHDPNRPIGTWTGVHAGDGKLKGTLNLAIDAFPLAERVRAGIAAGVYRAASIGFIPVSFSPNKNGGFHFHEIELLEGSVVALPSSRGSLRERSADNRQDRQASLSEIMREQRKQDVASVMRRSYALRRRRESRP